MDKISDKQPGDDRHVFFHCLPLIVYHWSAHCSLFIYVAGLYMDIQAIPRGRAYIPLLGTKDVCMYMGTICNSILYTCHTYTVLGWREENIYVTEGSSVEVSFGTVKGSLSVPYTFQVEVTTNTASQ